MKIKLQLLFTCFLFSLAVSAQWVQKANFPGTARAKAVSFTINNKVYVMGGVSNSSVILHDFWEYDISSDTWTAKPAFPGPERYGASSFVVNNKGYIATGGNDFGYLDDLWQYDPSAGSWIQRTGLPVGSAQHENQRREAFAFSIGSKGYLGGGDGFVFGANSTTNYAFSDLWEYNPLNDSWTSKAGIPDFLGRNMSIGCALNNKGYVGLGCDVWQATNQTSFWEYDPALDSWTAKANFPTNFTVDAGALVLDSELYVIGGVNINTIALSNQVYKYSPSANTWTALPSFNGNAIAGQVTSSAATEAFAGTGYNGSIVARNDWWEFAVTSGVENFSIGEGALHLYPNPAGNYIHANIPDEISAIEIYSVTGLSVLRQKAGFESIYVGDLVPGIYIAKIISNKGETNYSRMIKEK
jgi:N-acetylneuraminic acid mutarotase